MTAKNEDTKDKIINAAIELIKEKGKIDNITIRGITEKAGVAVSMINYHFQTKENLIDQAVQTFISAVMSRADDKFANLNLDPEQRLRSRVKQAADFLASNPGISRVSILTDLKKGKPGDNSSQAIQSIVSQLKEIYGAKKNDLEIKLTAYQILAALHELFLRANVVEQQTGKDYFNDQDREEMIDQLIDNLLDN